MEWISIEDRLPEDDTEVLIAYNYKDIKVVDVAEYNSKYFEQQGFWMNENGGEYSTKFNSVTHWMPLPEPPQ